MTYIENPEEHLQALQTIAKRLLVAKSPDGVVCGGLPIEIDDFLDVAGMFPAFMFRVGQVWTEATGEPNPIVLSPDALAVQGYRIDNFAVKSAGVISFPALDVCESLKLTPENRLDTTPLYQIFLEADKTPYLKPTNPVLP